MYFPHVANSMGDKKMQNSTLFVVFGGLIWQFCRFGGKIARAEVGIPDIYSQFCRTPLPNRPLFLRAKSPVEDKTAEFGVRSCGSRKTEGRRKDEKRI